VIGASKRLMIRRLMVRHAVARPPENAEIVAGFGETSGLELPWI
jgi:hypothetical protein